MYKICKLFFLISDHQTEKMIYFTIGFFLHRKVDSLTYYKTRRKKYLEAKII